MQIKHWIATGLVASCVTVSGWAADKIVAPEPTGSTVTVNYRKGDFIRVPAAVGYPVLVELPNKDKAMMPICGSCKPVGDGASGESSGAEDWLVQAVDKTNFVAILPLKVGVKTIIHVLGASGNVYTMSLVEVSKTPDLKPEPRISIVTSEPSMLAELSGPQKIFSASEVESLKKQSEEAQQQLEAERKQQKAKEAQDLVTTRSKVESGIKHSYSWDAGSKSAKVFNVHGIYESSGFTIIDAQPQETPSVYEKKDGKDSLIQYEFHDGHYVIPKLINDGYLRVGKSQMLFHREG